MKKKLHISSWCKIKDHTVVKNNHRIYGSAGSSAHEFLLALYDHFSPDYPKFFKMDPLSKLGWLASEVLLQEESLPDGVRPEETGLVFTNSNSSLDTDIKYLDSTRSIASPALFVYTLPNIMLGEICIRRGYKGENAFFIFPRFNAAFLEEYVTALFGEGALKVCICGWVDLLGDAYEAVLFLVTEEPGGLDFTKETMDNIYAIP